MKKICIIGSISTAIGLIFCTAVFAFAGFNAQAVSITHSNKTQLTKNITNTAQNIVIYEDVGDISIGIANGDDIVINYFENDNQTYDIKESDGNLYITKNYEDLGLFDNFNLFSFGIGFGINIDYGDIKLQVLLPKDFEHNIEIGGAVCNINIEDIDASNITIDVKNGAIHFNGVNADEIDANFVNASLDIDEVNVDIISVDTTNGSINFDDLKGNYIELESVNGIIEGGILGNASDYTITSEITFGNNNLPTYNKGETENNLFVKTTNGSINVFFDTD